MVLRGNPVSPGVALGEVYIYETFSCDIQPTYCEPDGIEAEKQRLAGALTAAGEELSQIIASFAARDADKAGIFAAHREILADEEIVEVAVQGIEEERKTAEFAVYGAFEEFIALVAGAKDAVIASRVVDFKDVRNRVLRILQGLPEKNLSSLPRPVVVVAHDLVPSDTATLDRGKVLGIVTETGGATSHSAIIANSYGIPAVLGVPGCTALLQDGQQVGVDALAGEVYQAPQGAVRQQLEDKLRRWQQKQAQEKAYLDKPARMADGTLLQIGMNIGSDEKLDGYRYCDFVGLFRTEFLYMENDHAPSEEEQFTAYKRVMEHAQGKPVTLRTLDIGGDKTLPYMTLPQEANPFLGKRALRLCLAEPELFRTQLRAALRASAYGEMWIMVPMVGSLDDIRRARAFFEAVKTELAESGIHYGKNVRFGIMIEIPAIALLADLAAQEVDFASIGTNDLCQYLCAADRMNPEVCDYYQAFSPAMVRLLGSVSAAFGAAGKPLSVCGEMAGDPRGAVLLAGLGIPKLSMSASKMAGAKAALAEVDKQQAQALAQKALAAQTQAEVIDLFTVADG